MEKLLMRVSRIALATLPTILLVSQIFGQETPPATQPDSPASVDRPATQPDAPRRERAARNQRPGANFRAPEDIQVVRDVVYAQATTDDGKPVELKMDTAFLKQSDGKPLPV